MVGATVNWRIDGTGPIYSGVVRSVTTWGYMVRGDHQQWPEYGPGFGPAWPNWISVRGEDVLGYE